MSIATCPVNIPGRYEGYQVVAVAVLVIAPTWTEDGRHRVLIRDANLSGPLRWVDMRDFMADPPPAEREKAEDIEKVAQRAIQESKKG